MKASSHYIEGLITYVDPQRSSCTVKTLLGHTLNSVVWLDSTANQYQAGDKVLILTGLTYPVIIGSLPKAGEVDQFTPNINTGENPVSQGNSIGLASGVSLDKSAAKDYSSGDHIISSDTGGMIGVLREGTIIARASKLAQVLISKLSDIVRVIARNFERISDFDQEASINLNGRMYRFYGFNRNFQQSKNGVYEYQEHFGDTKLSEQVGPDSYGFPTSNMTAANSVIRKKEFSGPNGTPYYVETLEDNTGRLIVTIGNTIRDQEPDLIQDSVGGTSNSTVIMTPTSTTVKFQGSVAEFDQEKVNITNSSGHYIRIDSSGVHVG